MKGVVLVTLLIALTYVANAQAEVRLRANEIAAGKLAFSLLHGKSSDLYLIDFATDKISPLAPSAVVDEYPSFSPDGKKLTFYSDRSGDREIYVVDTDGKNIKQLTNSPGADEDASWSPDGTQIVFQSARIRDSENLYVMNSDGTKQEPLTKNRKRNSVPRWSPDGKSIAFTTSAHWPGWDIDILELATKERKRTTSGIKTSCRPAWHPSENKFVYSSGNLDSMDLWINDLNTGEQHKITDLPGREYDPVWTADGKKIFFVAEKNKGKGDWEIFVLDVATKATTQLTDTEQGGIRYLSWTGK